MENLLLYKLMILYMLDRIDEYSLTNEQISAFILDKGYTDLFNIHEALSELIDKNFISANTIRDTQHYKITDFGEEALLYFEDRISNTIKQEIVDYFKHEKIKLKTESEISADYRQKENGEYLVECSVNEKKEPLMRLSFSVPDKTIARTICENWRTNNAEIYQYLVSELWNKKK